MIIQRKQVRIIFYYSLHNIEQGDTHRYLPVLFFPVSAVAHKSFHSKAVIQNALAQAKVFRGYLQQFVISKKLQTLFQAQDAGGIRRSASSEPDARVLVRCFVRQTLTGTSSAFGQTPTTIPPYTFVPGEINIAPRSCAFQMP